MSSMTIPCSHRSRQPSTISSLRLLCTLSLIILQSISAFQLHTTTTICRPRPPKRSIAAFLSSNEDAAPEPSSKATTASDGSGFGESVPLRRGNQTLSNNNAGGSPDFFALDDSSSSSSEVESLKENRAKNIAVALASFAVAIFNYGWHFTHPVTAVEILASMQTQSAPLTAIGNNGKPTVIDFWAPWCSSCKVAAPTLRSVEREYGDRVNFIMLNADDGRNWEYVRLFGVDAIPHLALLSGEGDVETALIGPASRGAIRADIDALLSGRGDCAAGAACHDDLPYTMFDAFGSRPEDRRINFVER